jgi:hypothetical protein
MIRRRYVHFLDVVQRRATNDVVLAGRLARDPTGQAAYSRLAVESGHTALTFGTHCNKILCVYRVVICIKMQTE